jgi:hypothetical protein
MAAMVVLLILFFMAPLLCIEALIGIAIKVPGASSASFIKALTELGPGLLLAGFVVLIAGGVAGYHLRRTKARLIFGMVYVASLLVYASVLFLGGAFKDALDALGWHFPALLAFGIAAYVVASVALRFLREYLYFGGKGGPEHGHAERSVGLGWGEFDLDAGDPIPALASAERYIRRSLTRVLIALSLLIALLYVFGFENGKIEEQFLGVLVEISFLFLAAGVPLTALALLRGYYPKGTRSRACFSLAASLLYVLFLFYVLVGSGLELFIRDNGLDIPVFPMTLALLAWAVVDVMIVGVEYREERGNWLKAVGRAEAPARKMSLSSAFREKHPDFDPSRGVVNRGLKGAKRALLFYVVIPEVIIMLIVGLLRALEVPSTEYGILGTWAIIVLVFGLLIAFISFWRSLFPPGSYGRLAAGMALVPGIAIYFLALGMQGGFYEALKQMGIILYMPGVQMLIVIFILLVGFRQIAEFADARREWQAALGNEVRPYGEIERMTRLQEFRIRFANKHDGVVWAGKGMVRYVFYTSFVIIFLISLIDSAVYIGTGSQLQAFSTTLSRMFAGLVLIAVPLAASRAFYGLYPQGSTSKLAAGYVMCAIGALYTYSSFRGGSMTMVSEGQTLVAGVAIDFTFIVILFTIGWAIWATTVTTEYFAHREAWVANGYRPVQYNEDAQSAAFEKIIAREGTRSVHLTEREVRRAERRARRRGTTVAEEKAREMNAKEAGVHVEEAADVAAEDEEAEAMDLEKQGDEEEEQLDI